MRPRVSFRSNDKRSFMKKAILATLLALVSGIGAFAQDAANSSNMVSAPTNEMQSSNTVADAAVLPTSSNVVVAPADASSTPTVATATVAQRSTPVATQPTYTAYPPASAPMEHRFGAGLIIGEPTGASLKYWLNDLVAVDGAFGWSAHDHSTLYMHADVLWHKFDLFDVPQGKLPLYFGVGGLVRFRDDGRDDNVGIRVPVGVSYMFDNLPLDVFAEIGPALDVAPDLHGEITGGVGIRFWF